MTTAATPLILKKPKMDTLELKMSFYVQPNRNGVCGVVGSH